MGGSEETVTVVAPKAVCSLLVLCSVRIARLTFAMPVNPGLPYWL